MSQSVLLLPPPQSPAQAPHTVGPRETSNIFSPEDLHSERTSSPADSGLASSASQHLLAPPQGLPHRCSWEEREGPRS